MKMPSIPDAKWFCLAVVTIGWASQTFATDHNEPDDVNSIFQDVRPDAADLYGVFGFPTETQGKESISVIATFSPAPATGKFDRNVMHRIFLAPAARVEVPSFDELPAAVKDPASALQQALDRAKTAVKETVSNIRVENREVPEVRVNYRVTAQGRHEARLRFQNFVKEIDDVVVTSGEIKDVETAPGTLKAFVGGRDDPFFTDLGGFFRSINYKPALQTTGAKGPRHCFDQASAGVGGTCPNFSVETKPREAEVTKSLLVLDDKGNFAKDSNGKYRIVYDGSDSRTHYNVNAIALEIPIELISKNPNKERQVRVWGESYHLLPENKIFGAPTNRRIYLTQKFQHVVVDPQGPWQENAEILCVDHQGKSMTVSSFFLIIRKDRRLVDVGFTRPALGLDPYSVRTVSAEAVRPYLDLISGKMERPRSNGKYYKEEVAKTLDLINSVFQKELSAELGACRAIYTGREGRF